ncbi:MAG: hypothetical protein ACREC5_01365, partial [Thermoplasmata archaeon]
MARPERRPTGPLTVTMLATPLDPSLLRGPRPEAMTFDAWYTLVYLRPKDREELERSRRRAWTDPLLRAGLSRSRATEALAELLAR